MADESSNESATAGEAPKADYERLRRAMAAQPDTLPKNTEQEPSQKGAVAGDAPASTETKTHRRSTATKVRTRGGVRTMKMYSLTEGELGELSLLQGGATICFSLASAAFGFWLSVTQAIAFSENLSEVVLATWKTWKAASLIVAVSLAVGGALFRWRGHCRLDRIKAEMDHD